jgi:hypothetical protein
MMDILTEKKSVLDPQGAAHKIEEKVKTVVSSVLANESLDGAVQKTIDQTKQAINDAYDTTVQAAGEAYQKTSQAVTETSQKALNYGRENPGSITLIAFGAGIGLGLLLAGSLYSHNRTSRFTSSK